MNGLTGVEVHALSAAPMIGARWMLSAANA